MNTLRGGPTRDAQIITRHPGKTWVDLAVLVPPAKRIFHNLDWLGEEFIKLIADTPLA